MSLSTAAEFSSSCTSEAPELSTSTSSGSVLYAASVLVNLRAPRLTRKRKIDRNLRKDAGDHGGGRGAGEHNRGYVGNNQGVS